MSLITKKHESSIALKPGDIIRLLNNGSVNGCTKFVVIDPFILDIRYYIHGEYDRKYEYSKSELLKPSLGEESFEVIGNIYRKMPPIPKYEAYHSKVLDTDSISEAERMIDMEHHAYREAIENWWKSLTPMEKEEAERKYPATVNFYITK